MTFWAGSITSTGEFGEGDSRSRMPRFTDENLSANQAVVDVVRDIATKRRVLPGQVALAWVHAQGPDVVPIPGTKRSAYLDQNAAAADLELTQDDLARLEALADRVVGSRY